MYTDLMYGMLSLCVCSAIVSKMAETEIDYMIQQLVETRVSLMVCM